MQRTLTLLLIVLSLQLPAQIEVLPLQIGFYNVENLFDTEDDPLIRDEEFLPEGRNEWTGYRYKIKLDNLAKVIVAMGGWEGMDLLGVCEIENRRVLEDLIAHPLLRNRELAIAHFNSPDRRGIDVGLIYDTLRFRLITSEPLGVVAETDTAFRTRDILYSLLCEKTSQDTLHVFVNHWPSRYGGQERSEPKRILAATTLREKTNSILKRKPEARIIILGDLNDEPFNNSVRKTLEAGSVPNDTTDFVDLMNAEAQGPGSHRYKGQWAWLDHIILSRGFFGEKGWVYEKSSGRCLNEDFLLEDDSRYPGKQPNRTYHGPVFHGGYSDHLPVLCTLVFTAP